MTPLLNIDSFYVKREDLNPTGSAKDRAIESQTNHLQQLGFQKAVISSSGNAAISAKYYCQLKNIDLEIFVSPKTTPEKLKLLESAKLHYSLTPISDAIKFSKQFNCYNLRQSTDPVAQQGYSVIGSEIVSQLPTITSTFIPVGSGTTLIGISEKLPLSVKIFAVQPASHAPIASLFDKNFTPETETVTDSLSVKFTPLKNKILATIKNRGSSAIVVQNQDVLNCYKMLKNLDICTSYEGCLALAGYFKAVKSIDVGKYPVILLTGTKR